MSNLKCFNCNLVNFANLTVCKRCQSDLTIVPLGEPIQATTKTAKNSSSGYQRVQTTAQLSVAAIIKNDYGAILGLIMPLALWGLFIAVNVFGFSFSRRGRSLPAGGFDVTFVYIALLGTVIGVALLVWRIYSFQQAFANGEETLGRITSVSFFKDRGRIEYSYTVNGQIFQTGNGIVKNQKTQSFCDGDEVALIVDRANPSRAFIKVLYCQ